MADALESLAAALDAKIGEIAHLGNNILIERVVDGRRTYCTVQRFVYDRPEVLAAVIHAPVGVSCAIGGNFADRFRLTPTMHPNQACSVCGNRASDPEDDSSLVMEVDAAFCQFCDHSFKPTA